ncbi:hypothetical protein JCM3774_006645 [Rhodotorula dairenensis]
MATPPASPPIQTATGGGTHSGPAWTRNVQKPSPRIAALGGAAGAAASASSLSLPGSAARGSGHATTDEAPYLTHVHRHHGQLTLVAPDNLGARRQPGTVDPPHLRHDAGGGWGVIDLDDPDLPTPEEATAAFITPASHPTTPAIGLGIGGKKHKLKKGTSKKKREKEQREKRERAIASAVANAGKSPARVSPLPSPADEYPPPPPLASHGSHLAPPTFSSNSTTPRASPGLSTTTTTTTSTTPAGSRPSMTSRSTSGTSSSLQQQATAAATVAAASRRARRTRPGVGGEDETIAGSSSRTSGSSAFGQSHDRRPLEGPRPQPLPLGAAAPSSSDTVRPPLASPVLTGSNIPAYLSATAPTPPLPPSRGGPLQQSRAVARARAARNAHAAVMQAGIQARAQQALSQLQDLQPQQQRRAELSSTSSTPVTSTRAATTARGGEAASSTLAAPTEATTTATAARRSQSPGGAGTETRGDGATARQRPRMRHRPSEPPLAPETVSPRSAAAATTTTATTIDPGPSRTRDGAPRPAAVSSAPPAAGSETSRPRTRTRVRDTAPPGASGTASTTVRSTGASPQTESAAPSSQNFVLPPLNLSDPSLLEDHLSLGLLDPAMLLMSPPPAYTGRRSLSSTRTMSTIGQNMGAPARSASERSASPSSARGGGGGGGRGAGALGLGLGMEPIRDGGPASEAAVVPSRRYSMPPSEPPPATVGGPPPPAPLTRLSPPPPLTSSSEASSSSEDDDDDDDDDDASSFEVTSTDPLVLAWEADRSAGIYSLDERIARDLERRRLAAAHEEDAEEEEDAGTAGASTAAPQEAEATTSAAGGAGGEADNSSEVTGSRQIGSSGSPIATRTGKSPMPAVEATTTTTEDDEQDFALLRRRISHAEASNNSRGVVRALSVHATRSLRAQGRVARERRGRVVPPPSATGEGGGSPLAEAAGPALAPAPAPLPVPETILEREEAEPSPGASSSLAATARPTAVPAPVAAAGPSSVPETDERPARSLSLRGHRMLAEAAERRMRAEKESRLRTAAAVEAQPAVAEEDAEDEAVAPSSPPVVSNLTRAERNQASTSPPPPTPPRPRVVPPPPPPRSRPLSGERSPAPAFTSSTPSIAWGAAAALPTQASLRRPASIRRAPPPPPPNAAEILAARRASLRPVTANTASSGGAASTSRPTPIVPPDSPAPPRETPTAPAQPSDIATDESSLPRPQVRPNSAPIVTATALAPAVPVVPTQHVRSASLAPVAGAPSPSPPRRRPLPTPPAPLGDDRIDAFTALRRQSQGLGTSISAPSSPAPTQAPVLEAQQQQQRVQTRQQQQEEETSAPGPPLPRRPTRREPPAPPVAISASAAPSTTEDATIPQVTAQGQVAAPTTASPSSVPQPTMTSPPVSPGLSMYTDLDLLLARLESQENGTEGQATGSGASADSSAPRGGQNYEDLLLLSDVLGQAVPSGATPAELAETLTVARVECERRRVTKSGKVKSKLSVVGVRCVDCAICLARFKVDQFAVVLPDFHEHCVRSWFRLSRHCPVCRDEVFKRPASEAAGASRTATAGAATTGTTAGSASTDLLA